MFKPLALLAGVLVSEPAFAGAEVLIVADEFPAMEWFADTLKTREGITTRVVAQTNLPPRLAGFSAVIVYIHGNLAARTEQALIDYTRAGGKLIALHHSISSGKRKNAQWFKFLGVALPEGDVSQGGYKWIEPVTLDLVRLAPGHFITTNQVNYPDRVDWPEASAEPGNRSLPGFTLHESEVYLNHVLTEPRTQLLGFKFTDAKSGQVWRQDHAGWVKPAGRGWIVYLLPGHSLKDFEHPTYARIVLNAVTWKP
jgi:hypothetical protein